MRILQSPKGDFRFEEVPDVVYQHLMKVGEIAEVDPKSNAAKRLYPNLLAPSEPRTEKHEEMEADWRQFVRPELETANSAAIQTVLLDLAKAKKSEGEDGESVFAFDVPNEHIPRWYQAYNLARLVLAEEHQLPFSKFPLAPGKKPSAQRMLAAQVSDIYAFLLEMLVSQMMEELG